MIHPTDGEPVSIDAIRSASGRLRGIIHTTPLLTSRSLDEECGRSIVFKAEHLQVTGSFKARGALNAILLRPGEAGYLAVSSGNHGAAVAWAARRAGATATVVMPEDSSPEKMAKVRAYGATVVSRGVTPANREDRVRQLASETGQPVIHPFDDDDVIAGQGTIGLELASSPATFDAVLVAVGGGGLASGVATALAALRPEVDVIGVEPEEAADAAASLAAGRIVPLQEPPMTLADAVRTMAVGARTFPILQKHLSRIITVDEQTIARAHGLLLDRLKQVVEPTAALAFAPLVNGADLPPRVCVILCGGNWMPSVMPVRPDR